MLLYLIGITFEWERLITQVCWLDNKVSLMALSKWSVLFQLRC